MTILTKKFQTEDPKRALEIVEDRRNRGYDAWIEDESGKIVDERAVKNKFELTKPTLRERTMGLLVILATVVVALGIGRFVG